MKKSVLYMLICVLASSCAGTYKEIGGLNLLSDHKIDPNKSYQQITTASGSRLKDIKHAKAENMKDAIDAILKAVPGGEYLTNVKVYAVHGGYIAISGDVWGRSDSLSQQNSITTVSNKK